MYRYYLFYREIRTLILKTAKNTCFALIERFLFLCNLKSIFAINFKLEQQVHYFNYNYAIKLKKLLYDLCTKIVFFSVGYNFSLNIFLLSLLLNVEYS